MMFLIKGIPRGWANIYWVSLDKNDQNQEIMLGVLIFPSKKYSKSCYMEIVLFNLALILLKVSGFTPR